MATTRELLDRLSGWLDEARAHPHIPEYNAMSVATADASGMPSSRMVLLKDYDERGFVFYTNDSSMKAQQLRENPKAALLLYWMPLGRQFRAHGKVESATPQEADAYFATRSRGSRIGAWASDQSAPLESRGALMAQVAKFEERFAGKDVPRPPHWNGWRIIPEYMEFWQEAEYRLHERSRYLRIADSDNWEETLLNP